MYSKYIVPLINHPIFKMIMLYIICIIFHYLASHLYTYFCVPRTIIGFIISPFMTLSPHCQGLRWVIYNGGNSINMMWFILASWLINKVKFHVPVSDITPFYILNADYSYMSYMNNYL